MSTTNVLSIGDIQVCPRSINIVSNFLQNTAIEIIEQEDINVVVIAGDLFEYSQYTNNYVPPSHVIMPYVLFFEEMRKRNIDVVIIAGNHDKTYGSFINATDIFLGDHIYNTSTAIKSFEIGNCNFICVPWLISDEYDSKGKVLLEVSNLAKKSKKEPMLVGHIRIVDSVESGHKIEKTESSFDFLSKDLDFLPIEYGFLGDIHIKHNVLRKIDYLGSLFQRNFGEAGRKSYVRVTKVSENGVDSDEYIELQGLPEFIILSATDEVGLQNMLDNHDFISENMYRIDINFETGIRSKFKNVIINKKTKSRSKVKTVVGNIGKKITEEDMIKIYNKSHNSYKDEELKEVVDLFNMLKV